MADSDDRRPPYYVLVSHTAHADGDSTNGGGGGGGSGGSMVRTLGHAEIQYQYADDPPLTLLPRTTDEQVLVLDHGHDGPARAQTLSGPGMVAGVVVTDAPGADASAPWSGKMYVVQTTAVEQTSAATAGSPQATVARFRERNAVIRQVLEYTEGREEGS